MPTQIKIESADPYKHITIEVPTGKRTKVQIHGETIQRIESCDAVSVRLAHEGIAIKGSFDIDSDGNRSISFTVDGHETLTPLPNGTPIVVLAAIDGRSVSVVHGLFFAS